MHICISTVIQKYTDTEACGEAIAMLTHNSQNLVSVMEEVLCATEIATIKLQPSMMEKLGLKMVEKVS